MKGEGARQKDTVVLVGVLKTKRDLSLLLREYWHRIPALFMPKRRFTHVAFYQPAIFGRHGKRIVYYARVLNRTKMKRIDLLPKEARHPRAQDDYVRLSFRKIHKLARPIKNIIPRRVSFGFTTLRKLRSAKDILELYGVPKTEQIIARRLRQMGMKVRPEHTVSRAGKRYRIDIAVFCKDGSIAIECDNKKAHSGKSQLAKDKAKDVFLINLGWRVIRLPEKDILEHPDRCVAKVVRAIQHFGGQ